MENIPLCPTKQTRYNRRMDVHHCFLCARLLSAPPTGLPICTDCESALAAMSPQDRMERVSALMANVERKKLAKAVRKGSASLTAFCRDVEDLIALSRQTWRDTDGDNPLGLRGG